jgi:LPS sulfotransferase NodH
MAFKMMPMLIVSFSFLLAVHCDETRQAPSIYWLQADGRSGTTLLGALLDLHPRVAHLHESVRLRTPPNVQLESSQLASVIDTLLNDALNAHRRNVKRNRKRSRRIVGELGALGFKVGPTVANENRLRWPPSVDDNRIELVVNASDMLSRVRFIHLVRNDEVSRQLSMSEARNSSVYVSSFSFSLLVVDADDFELIC